MVPFGCNPKSALSEQRSSDQQMGGEQQHGGCPRGVSADVNDVVHCCLMFYCYTLLLIARWDRVEALLLATQRLHQEHEAPYTHRSKDGEEDDGEPEGCLGDEAGQFVHKLCCLSVKHLGAKIVFPAEKGCCIFA